MSAAHRIHLDGCMGLDEAGHRLGVCAKTLATFLRKNPQIPPLFAKPGRDYIISPADLDRIYRVLQEHFGKRRFDIPAFEARKAKPRKDKGFIYFAQGENTRLIKIGYAADPYRRLKALQTGSAEPISLLLFMPGSLADERAIHDEFASCRERGEWFRPTQELAALIRKARP